MLLGELFVFVIVFNNIFQLFKVWIDEWMGS